MSAPRFGRFQKVTALLPLALLSTAVTASLAGLGSTTAAAGPEPDRSLPDGTAIPDRAIQAPASVSQPGVVAPGLDSDDPRDVIDSASASGIPAAALAAYQRAETVINAADRSCNLPWQLVAAIGRVESDHGRANGNTLDDEGVARPGIYGIPLNGTNNTRAIRDTDAGQYDSDSTWDRAVGPMQFIPSTWSVVGVDGDDDGQRNPQDIDDAALAAAVYLCSGNGDLSTDAGRRDAVFRYNHSQAYVDLVLSIMQAYLSGDFTSVPNSVTASTPEPFTPTPGSQGPGGKNGNGGKSGNGGKNGGNGSGNNPGGPGGPGTPGQGGGDGDAPELPAPDLPEVDDPEVDNDAPGTVKNTVKDTVDDTTDTVEETVTKAQATTQCLAKLGADSVASLSPLQLLELNKCVDELLG